MTQMKQSIKCKVFFLTIFTMLSFTAIAQWTQSGTGAAGTVNTPGNVGAGGNITAFGNRIFVRNDGEARFHLYNGGGQAEWLMGQKSADNHSFILSKKAGIQETDFLNIYSTGRVHIDGPERLYLLNREGVRISKSWGGNGDLAVEGDLTLSGNTISAGIATFNNVRIGTNSPALGVNILANFPGYSGGWARGFSVSNHNNTIPYFEIGALGSATNGNTTFIRGYIGTDYNHPFMNFFPDGKIAIGTIPITPGGYRLFVDQGILTEKVKVAVAGSAQWADYVFAHDYNLMPLNEVESFIKSNRHLPGVPSAADMVKEGNDLGRTDAKLLEKIEELTLYIIAQQKEIAELKQSVFGKH
jgi:hypothetical protein